MKVILSEFIIIFKELFKMAESSKAATITKQAQIKAKMKGFLPVSQINSRWKEISDTNLGTLNPVAFKIRMFGTTGHNPSPTTVKFVKSGIVAAAGFPLAIQCPDLILECAKHYNPERKTISTLDGRLLATLTLESIGEAFGIPSHHSMTYRTISGAQELYDAGPARCADIINKQWLLKPRPHVSKMPKTLTIFEFKQKYVDLIKMLSRVMGCSHTVNFETWMFFYIGEIMNANELIDWAKLINHYLHEQFKDLKERKSQSFFMSSYVIYMLARREGFDSLPAKGIMGCGPAQLKVHECYPQLHLHNVSSYKLANDTFTMYLIRLVQKELHTRVPPQARALVQKYGATFLLFPKFTYIRMQGFSFQSHKLPR